MSFFPTPLTKLVSIASAFVLATAGALVSATSAQATTPTITVGTPTGVGVTSGIVTTESAVTLPITISGFGAASKLDVLLSVPVGQGYFSVSAGTTAIAANYGYSDSTNITEYAFSGTVADVTSVLASGITWVAPAAQYGDFTVSIAQSQAGVSYNHVNHHYYKAVNSSNITWSSAVDLADNTSLFGMTGYLATVTSRQENNFITYNVTNNGIWIGGSDAGPSSDGSIYTWRTGPESGQQFWQGDQYGWPTNSLYAGWVEGEPSSTHYTWACGFLCFDDDYENFTALNFNGHTGQWVDLMNQPTNRPFASDHIDWYLIEYGGMGSDSPSQLTASTTASVAASPSIVLGTMNSSTFTAGVVNAAWSGTAAKSFAVGLQRFENTSSTDLSAVVTVPAGSLTAATTTGLSLTPGYTSFTDSQSLGFYGLKADVIAALKNLRWTPPADYGQTAITVSVSERQPGMFYNPANGHYYQVKTWGGNTSIQTANTFARAQTYAGMTGYLATITSTEENQFIADHTTAANAWIGASDDDGTVNGVSDQRYDEREGDWTWFTGPEAGTEFWQGGPSGSIRNGLVAKWATGEPNNTKRNLLDSIGEDFAVTNFNGNLGRWNDVLNDAAGVTAAIVEFGGMPNEPNSAKAVSIVGELNHVIAPAAPTLSSVNVSDGTVSATLTKGVTNGAAITNFQYSTDGGTTWSAITEDLTATSGVFSVSSLTNGQVYSLCAREYNFAGWSSTSTCETVVPAKISDAPSLSDMRPRDGGYRVIVSPGTSNGGDTVSSWEVAVNGGAWTQFATYATFDGYLTSLGTLTNGTTYSICVRAINGQGPSASSNCLSVTPHGATNPAAPTIDNVVVNGSTATVTVHESADDGGADISDYFYSLDGGTTWTAAPDPLPAPGEQFLDRIRTPSEIVSAELTHVWNISGFTAGTSYQLKFRVANTAGYTADTSAYVVDFPAENNGGGHSGSGHHSTGSSTGETTITSASASHSVKHSGTAIVPTPTPTATATPKPSTPPNADGASESDWSVTDQVWILWAVLGLILIAGCAVLIRRRRG